MQAIDIFPWNDKFNTGIALIDEQHQQLVRLINQLACQLAFAPNSVELVQIFDELADYAGYHFRSEEGIWHQHFPGDADEAAHQHTHQAFLQAVGGLRAKQGNVPMHQIAEEALAFLVRWLTAHILQSDRRLAFVVHALERGLDLAAAKQSAKERLAEDGEMLISLVLTLFDALSRNTVDLMRELAERKENERQLELARAQAEAASAAKGRFLSVMSHELRTPMNGILGMAQMLQDAQVTDDERIEFATTIHDSGQALMGMLKNILDHTEADTGQLTLRLRPVRLADVLAHVQAEHAHAAERKGLALVVDATALGDTHYLADEKRLADLLSHLVSNGVKFTQAGSVRIAGRELSRSGNLAQVELTVSDTGMGIAPEHHAHIFDTFTQADTSTTRRHGGIGLGLSLVRKLAELMDGSVRVDSVPGQGARFIVTVPLGVTMGVTSGVPSG